MFSRITLPRFAAILVSFSLLTFGVYAALTDAGTYRTQPNTVAAISDQSLPAEVQGQEALTVNYLFDRDTNTEHTLFSSGSVDALFDSSRTVNAIRIFGAAPYTLSVESVNTTGDWQAVSGLSNIDLTTLTNQWNSFNAASAVLSNGLRFKLTPVTTSTATGLKEIEIWTNTAHVTAANSDQLVSVAALNNDQVMVSTALPTEGVIGGAGDDTADNTFTANLAHNSSSVKRAYLVYELFGAGDWTQVSRTVNGLSAQGNIGSFAQVDQWTTQVEAISPQWLNQGANTIAFATPTGVSQSYTVRNVRLMVELDDGANFIGKLESNQDDDQNILVNLYDGNINTSWMPYPNGSAVRATVPEIVAWFDKPTQVASVDLSIINNLKGSFTVELYQNNVWSSAGIAAVDANTLSSSWNAIAVNNTAPATGLRIQFSGGKGSSAEIQELTIKGSGVGTSYNPTAIQVSYPNNGQYVGRVAYIRGFILPVDNGSGTPTLSIGGQNISHVNGAFETTIDKDNAGYAAQGDSESWAVVMTATYPDGEIAQQLLMLDNYTAAPDLGNSDLLQRYAVTVAPGQAKKIAYDEAELDITATALDVEKTISVTPLSELQMPALDPGMTNVTKGPRKGYRFLPHGKFKDKIKVRLPYKKSMIPPGHTEDDIKTFYFDEEAGSWKELTRTTINKATQMIESETDHFTDMINATVTVPDSPQAASFNPTQIKDIKAADPGASINLIEPPKANNMGDARLSYPIEVPPGRQSLQPQLSVSYNSSGGNGWMGLGWDIPMQAITVDTRWGVPRYSSADETETYSLSGEQLTPVAHRGALIPRTAEKIFHTRVEGSFRKIIRHGTNPANYWWEVIDKNGTRYFYGGGPDTSNLPASNSTLVDGSGNIFKWSLRVVLDTNGNFVKYNCERVSDVGIQGGSVAGSQLYLKSINYTGHTTTGTDFSNVGPFKVTFVRDSEVLDAAGQRVKAQRRDIGIDARGGFKMVTGELLSHINVDMNGARVRSYVFNYAEGAFAKQLLQDVAQLDTNGNIFNTHTFDYYDEIRDTNGNYQGYANSETWLTGADGVSAGLLAEGDASALSGTYSKTIGGHLYVGFNFAYGDKYFSFGGKVGHSRTESEGRLSMIDINGDGLPDKVFKDGGIKYRPNLSGPYGTTTFGQPVSIPTLSDFMKENSRMTSHGPEAFVGVSAGSNSSNTFTQSSVYFSDVNGDGLTDVVSGGQVLFNRLVNGVPTFTSDSSQTPYPIGAGAVDANNIIEDYEAIYQENIDTFPLLDSVRRWVVPYNGIVNIAGDVALVEDTSQARALYTTADGVRVAVQHNGSELWSSTIGATDYAAKTPTGLTGISVTAGDIIYFRVQSVFDGAYDQVSWTPSISYQSVPALTDVNGLNPYAYSPSSDFTLAGRRGLTVRMPLNGTIRLTGTLQKLAATSDNIELQIIKNGVVQPTPGSLIASQIGDLVLNQDITVATEDTLAVRVKIDSPIDITKLNWLESNPLQIVYIASPDTDQIQDSAGNYLIRMNPSYDYDLYPESNLSTPLQAWTATQTGSLTVIPNLSVDIDDTTTTGDVYVTVKQQNALIAKQKITFANGSRSGGGAFTINVVAGQQYYFEFSAFEHLLKDTVFGKSITLTYSGDTDIDGFNVASEFHSGSLQNILPQAYRGWNVFGYNGNRDRANSTISVTPADFNVDENYDPAAAKVNPFYPQTKKLPEFPNERWNSGDNNAWADANIISSSRLGLDYIDVPRPGSYAGSRAVTKLSRSSQDGGFLGVSFLSGSKGNGSSYSQVDFMDMNGDRFPDVLGNANVQFTDMTGGLESTSSGMPGYGSKPRDTSNTSGNIGIGGNMSQMSSNSEGTGGTSGSQMPPIGFGAGKTEGTVNNNYDLMDVNGDGLPDRVTQSGGNLSVALNLGYKFAPSESWKAATINSGSSDGTNVSLGYNNGIFGWGGGLSLSTSDSKSSASLLDVNGDGLLDRVYNSGGNILVGFNTGNGFLDNVIYNGGFGQGFTKNVSKTLGGGGYYTYGIGPLCWFACYVIINPGLNLDEAMAAQELSIRDIDGDGYPDQLASTKDDTVTVSRNRIGRTNLLKKVNRPLGANFEMQYERSGNTFAQPQSRWVMNRVDVFDGFAGDGIDTQVTTYKYLDGYHNREEREFYGYKTVVEEHRNAASNDELYRSITRTFLNDSYYSKGLTKLETVTDASGNKFTETENTYLLRNINTGLEVINNNSLIATVFPELKRTDKRFYEGQATPGKSTYTTHEYDAIGNIVRYVDTGDTGAQDDVEAIIGYFNDAANYIVGKPNDIVVMGDGNLMRHRDSVIEIGTGNTTQVNLYLGDGSTATTDITYDAFGNIKTKTGPANTKGQRYGLSYTYDPEVNTYVERVDDTSFGYFSTASYDKRWGKVTNTTDINGQPMTYVYDNLGRTQTITGPYEETSGAGNETITFNYFPFATVPYALTGHLDRNSDNSIKTDRIETVLFTDGLKRVLQTKKDASIFVGTGDTELPVDKMVVSGRVTFDFVGRTIEQRYPVEEALGQQGIFNNTTDTVQATVMTYDVLDRNRTTTIPDNTSTSIAYGFGADRNNASQFMTTVTDANTVKKQTFRDVRDVITSVKEFNKNNTEIIWTSYQYDPLKQITKVTDDKGNDTTVTYDNFGRRTQINNRDTGLVETVYDLASNVISKITPNLRATGQSIDYDYDFTRLNSISYPNNPLNNVAYTYGAMGATYNRANRIITATSEAGTEERFYGKLGEVEKTIHTIITAQTPNEPEVYTSQYVYDTWNRLRNMTYPDGEKLTYQYNAGGLLNKADGEKDGYAYRYIQRLEYDKFEQRKFILNGNNTRTQYSYDPKDRRLATLQSGKGDGNPFQALSYTYDDVGNITNLANSAAITSASQIGGATSQTFSYDDLYRLTNAKGSFDTQPTGKQHAYNLDMSYDTIHNIQFKAQLHTLRQPSGTLITQKKTSYNWNYAYNGSQPHAPTHIGDRTFSYDNNGNQTGWTHDNNGTRRTIDWDEENRIQTISDNGHTKYYTYNDAGERVIKRGPQGETVYVSQYFTMRNKEIGTKHIYAGSSRVVSKMMKQDKPGANPRGRTPIEKDLYFYHPDHLGSSSYVTDTNGKIYQHLEYFPFGETWIEEASNTQRTPYHFTAKELDEETGLYYFGARYYDPRTSVWQSVDPILGKYLDSNRGVGGGLNSKNFGLYVYSHQNPVGLLDPNGREAVVKGGIIYINPRGVKGGPVPKIKIKNNVGAKGFKNSDTTFHDYNYAKPAASNNAKDVGNAIAQNPTPGNDAKASKDGTINDVGDLAPMDKDYNLVRSFLVPSPDPKKYTDITVNYTIAGEHAVEEGYVMKFGEIDKKGNITLRSYGEGNSWKQTNAVKWLWKGALDKAWNTNHDEINKSLKK